MKRSEVRTSKGRAVDASAQPRKKVQPQPMSEGIRKKRTRFSPEEIKKLIRMRNNLISKGMTEFAIAKVLAKELGSSPRSIAGMLRKMRRDGLVQENPNKQDSYGRDDVEAIKKMREKLVLEGLGDKSIAQRIAGRLNKKKDSVYDKIRKMVKGGKIRPNPHHVKKEEYTKKEIKEVKTLREGLVTEGLNDKAISRKIAKKLGRTNLSVAYKIARMVKGGELPPNPNKGSVSRDFFPRNPDNWEATETEWLVRRRNELKSVYLDDGAIPNLLAEESGKNSREIARMISELVKVGKLEENRNEKDDSNLIERMIRGRGKLINEGKNDREIAKVLAKRFGKRPQTLMFLIWKIVEKGKCERNPNS